MPYVSQAQRRFMHARHPKIAARWDKEYPNQKGLPQRKSKAKISVNNKLKGSLGEINLNRKGEVEGKKLKIQINVKAHKGDKKELASTIKHELLHAKHPKMTEREVYRRSAKTKIAPQERHQLLSKLRNANITKKVNSLKSKMKMDPGTKVEPGDLFNRAKELSEETRVGISGLV